MGLLRYLLAIAVVIAHSAPIPGLPIVGGGLAVKLFFLVSGFYMGLILTEKYQPLPGGQRLFFSNRFLRIFPIFWLVFAVELAVALLRQTLAGGDPWIGHVLQLGRSGQWGTVFALIASQITLLGAEWTSLFSWTPGAGFGWHRGGLPEDSIRGWRFLLMPHSWTLACEWFFYALAPWLNRLRSGWLGGLIGANLALIHWLPGWIDPALAEVATDTFAPLQLGFFVAGLLAYRLYARHDSRIERGWPGRLLIAGLAALVLGFDVAQAISHRLSLAALFVVGALALPALFALTKQIRWDRRIGDLSYPVYLVHALVITLLIGAWPEWLDSRSPWLPITAIAASTVLAWLIESGIDRKLDRFRQNRLAHSMQTANP